MVHLLRYTKKSGSVYCCRGKRNRTSDYGSKMHNVSAVSFHYWTRKYVVLPLHHSPKAMVILHISTISTEPKA